MRVLRFFNRQRAVSLDKKVLRGVVRGLLENCLDRMDYQLGVHFIGATEMARLNESFLGHEGSTDVITFDHQETPTTNMVHCTKEPLSLPSPRLAGRGWPKAGRGVPWRQVVAQHAAPTISIHGEIFISVDDALIYARQFRVPWQSEVTRYIVHGVLHLEGFDDTDSSARRTMKKRENRLLKELSTRFDLAKVAGK